MLKTLIKLTPHKFKSILLASKHQKSDRCKNLANIIEMNSDNANYSLPIDDNLYTS